MVLNPGAAWKRLSTCVKLGETVCNGLGSPSGMCVEEYLWLPAGTGIALLGTYLYTEATKKYKAAPAAPKTTPPATA